jgi:hypothetical protein
MIGTSLGQVHLGVRGLAVGKGEPPDSQETLSCALQYNCCVAIKQGSLMAGPPFFHQE